MSECPPEIFPVDKQIFVDVNFEIFVFDVI